MFDKCCKLFNVQGRVNIRERAKGRAHQRRKHLKNE
jgi:hypothetical protein